MTHFGEAIQKLPENKRKSPAKICRLLSLNHSTVRDWLNGHNRIPNRETAMRIIHVLSLNPEDARMLEEAWELDSLGEKDYRKRQLVEQFISSLSAGALKADLLSHSGLKTSVQLGDSALIPLASEHQLCLALQSLLDEAGEKDAETMLLVPADFPQLASLLCQHRDQKITQIFSFSRRNSALTAEVILHSFTLLLPALFACRDYTTLYYNGKPDRSVPCPWYVCAAGRVLLIARDCSFGMLLNSAELFRFYQEAFQESRNSASVFLRRDRPGDILLDYYTDLMKRSGMPAFNLEIQSCISCYIDQYTVSRMIDSLPPGCPAELLEAADAFYDYTRLLRKSFQEKKVTTFFSEKGIRYFMDTGVITEFPDLIPPFPFYLRFRLIQNMADSFDQFELYMLREELSDNTGLARLYVAGGCGYIQLRAEDGTILTLDIQNGLLLNALSVYFQKRRPDYCYSREESRQRLQQVLEEYRPQLYEKKGT